MPAALPQLDLFAPDPHAETPKLVVTRPLRAHRSCRRVLERVRYVRRFFPELDDVTIKVGITRAASGMAVMGGYEIWLNPSRPSYHTIAHEFVHLLQTRGHDIPQGERSCDLFSLARDWTLNDVSPSYVKIPARLLTPDAAITPAGARLVHEVASEAITCRAQGLRTYIAWFEKRLRELTASRSTHICSRDDNSLR